MQWATAISEDFLKPSNRLYRDGLRDFDFILKLNGSVKNLAEVRPTDGWKKYPAAYEIPQAITEHTILNKVDIGKEITDFDRSFDNNIGIFKEWIARTELFALGCILYELISGNGLYPELRGTETYPNEIEARYAAGIFPDDL